jgi:hypothetical protein
MRLRSVCWLLATLTTLSLSEAGAQEEASSDVRADRALFDEALEDEKASRWSDALRKLRRILTRRETASLRYHLALCEEKSGLLASAHRDYMRAIELAHATSGPNRKVIIERSGEALKSLTPRTPQLGVRVLGSAVAPRARLDGEPFSLEPTGAPVMVDPGPHTLEVSAPGHKTFRRSFVLKEHESYTLSVPLDPEAPAAPGGVPRPSPPPRPEGRPAAPSPALTWALAGTSVGLGGAAAGFFLTALGQQRDLERCRDAPDVYLCREDDIAGVRVRNYVLSGVAGTLSLTAAGAALWCALGGGAPSSPNQGQAIRLFVGPATAGLRVSF